MLDYDGNGIYDPNIDKYYAYGGPSYRPVVGDWNGDGRTKIGIYGNGIWALDYNGDGIYQSSEYFGFGGAPGEQPVVGDWNGDGRTKVGTFRAGIWALDFNGNQMWDPGDRFYNGFGSTTSTAKAVIGNWNGGRASSIGTYDQGFWRLDFNANGVEDAGDKFYAFGGQQNEIPIVGDWNGSGAFKIGVYRPNAQPQYAQFVINLNGNGLFDSGEPNFYFPTGAMPLVGQWRSVSGTPGVLERVDPFYITGWAASSASPLTPVSVDIFSTVNNVTTYLDTVIASMPRRDLGGLGSSYSVQGCYDLPPTVACPGAPYIPIWWHGFAYPVPDRVQNDGAARIFSAKVSGTSTYLASGQFLPQTQPGYTFTRSTVVGGSTLEENLGPVPLEAYQLSNCSDQTYPSRCISDPSVRFLPSCSNNVTVQACYQNLLSNYKAQGITGVRFFIPVCGGYTNSPQSALTGCGSQAQSAIGFNQFWIKNSISLLMTSLSTLAIRRTILSRASRPLWTSLALNAPVNRAASGIIF